MTDTTKDLATIREALKCFEGMTSCRGDDDFVWGAKQPLTDLPLISKELMRRLTHQRRRQCGYRTHSAFRLKRNYRMLRNRWGLAVMVEVCSMATHPHPVILRCAARRDG